MSCYLCGSPVEKSPDGVAVLVECDGVGKHHLICSMCTSVLKEARYKLKNNGKVVIKRSSVGVVTVDV